MPHGAPRSRGAAGGRSRHRATAAAVGHHRHLTKSGLYHYTECGLDNVWLINGFRVETTPYGKGVAIENTGGLHRAIAQRLLDESGHLTGPEFRFLRRELDMSQAELASIVGNDAQSIALWEKHSRVPKWADRFLRALYREAVLGKADILSMIEHLNGRAPHKRLPLHFKETAKGWHAAAA